MPTGCCVPGCSNRGGHKFPTDTDIKNQWIKAIKRNNWTPTKTSRICKAHFIKEDYLTTTYHGNCLCYAFKK